LTATDLFARHLPQLLLWGLVATVAMTTILQGSQGLGLSRLSLPFLVGTFFTSNRDRATVIGFIVYVIGGWGFAMLYFLFFAGIGLASWWLGALLGFLHGLFLLVGALPLLPYAHPRMASEHDGPGNGYILEPPGFLGLNYGRRTPLTTLLGQIVYGATLGGLLQASGVLAGSGG
jgi:hypothetical protein